MVYSTFHFDKDRRKTLDCSQFIVSCHAIQEVEILRKSLDEAEHDFVSVSLPVLNGLPPNYSEIEDPDEGGDFVTEEGLYVSES